MNKKKIITITIISVISLVLIGASLFVLRLFLNKPKTQETVYQARIETYENVIEVSGTVAAAQEQTLQALSAGTVVKVYVKPGDRVRKGNLILQMDDTTEQYNLEKHDYDMAITKITGSEKELKLKQTQRLSLVQKIADRKVTATFSGVIADLDVAAGDYLEAKDSVGTLVNVDYLTAEVEVSETDVSKLKVGQEVELKFAACDETVKGKIESWPAIGEITSRGATVVKAKIRIDDYPSTILPNFSFTGKIQIEEPVEYVVVEKYAIAYEDKQAYVQEALTGDCYLVKVVPYGSEYVKVIEGLDGNELLAQLRKPSKSGQKKNSQKGGSGPSGGMPGGNGGNNNRGGQNFGGGMPPMP